jgi:hypothetical protein
MTEATYPTTIAELTQEIESARGELLAIFMNMPPTAVAEPSSPDDWSLLDHMAHLGVWAKGMAALLRREHRWEAMGLPDDVANAGSIDGINAYIYEQYKNKTPQDIQAVFEGGHQDLVKTLATLQDADLQRPYTDFRVTDTTWDIRPGPVVARIARNSYAHYREHVPWMLAWIERHHPDDVPYPPTIAELTQEIEKARGELLSIFMNMPPTAVAEPSAPDNWSLLDHMAHLGTWTKGIAALLRREHRWNAMALPADIAQRQDTDEINAYIYEQYQGKPPQDIQPVFEGGHQAILSVLGTMQDADLQKLYSSFRVAGTEWDTREGPVVRWIVGNTYDHYRDHKVWMLAWIAKHHPLFKPFPATIAGLTQAIEEARTALEAAFTHLPDAKIAAPSTPKDWSVKDHLAHLATWAQGIVALLRREHRWESMGLTHDFIENNDIDVINNVIYERYKDHSLAEIRAYFNEVHQNLLAELAKLNDSDLQRSYDEFQGEVTGIYDPDDKRPVINWIVGNTSGHYAEHLPWIQNTIARHAW